MLVDCKVQSMVEQKVRERARSQGFHITNSDALFTSSDALLLLVASCS